MKEPIFIDKRGMTSGGIVEIGIWCVFDADPKLAPKGRCQHHLAHLPSRTLNLQYEANRIAKAFQKYGSKVTAEELLALVK